MPQLRLNGNDLPENLALDPDNPPAGASVVDIVLPQEPAANVRVTRIKIIRQNPTSYCVYYNNGTKKCYS
jgi:hypothetical protein